MARYINPLTDFGFKTLFGTELNKDLLADFLNQLLPEHHRIASLEYRRTEQLGSSELEQESELTSQKDRWLYFIKNLAKLENIPHSLQERLFEKAFEKAEIARFNPEERVSYESSLKYYWDFNNAIDASKEDGEAQGLIKGIAQGKAEGELERAKEIALNLMGDGLPDEKISRLTKLDVSTVIALRQSYGKQER